MQRANQFAGPGPASRRGGNITLGSSAKRRTTMEEMVGILVMGLTVVLIVLVIKYILGSK